MDPKKISILDYTYALPEDRIAAYPLEERDQSKLLIYHPNAITEDRYINIAQYIPAESLVVFNNTKVVEARLLFRKPTGANIEIFCLEPHPRYRDLSTAMQQKGSVLWLCLIGGASKWKHGQVLEKILPGPHGPMALHATWREKIKDSFAIELSWNDPAVSFAEILHLAGVIPLPPYIKRAVASSDAERYQTIYAQPEGSVAAPTAGLHFTSRIFEDFKKQSIQTAFLTLHVGAGTFKPVTAGQLGNHEMHAEFLEADASTIELLLQGKPVFAIGTTSMRALESLYWMGVKTLQQEEIDEWSMGVGQWDPYESNAGIPAADALESLLLWMKKSGKDRIISKTRLMIVPGYSFRVVHALISNFHQPQSTLLLLVAAFVGEDWKKIYQYAMEHEFRFLSYGDGCLLFRN